MVCTYKIICKKKIQSSKGNIRGTQNLYCSDECKQLCQSYGKSPEYLIKQDKIRAGIIEESSTRDPYTQHQFRQHILDEYGTSCERCGIIGVPVDVHHVVPLATCDVDILLWDVDNGMVVCKNCHHSKLHKGSCSPTSLSRIKYDQ
jgi:5-methylcytosine-specific restriction endonuclease McrA